MEYMYKWWDHEELVSDNLAQIELVCRWMLSEGRTPYVRLVDFPVPGYTRSTVIVMVSDEELSDEQVAYLLYNPELEREKLRLKPAQRGYPPAPTLELPKRFMEWGAPSAIPYMLPMMEQLMGRARERWESGQMRTEP